ncbi:hypothetical protein ZEAMMB73_Zm00001d047065 [Zea mays]|uniref:Uncharacterized protein n=1 Tax=Zea mays TaxID=4577 RepID=A0A1D6P6Q0_MAIZE|nr:hypothetical protein ZEAMMB73_Zm00001d047065 [Zea mays]
MDARTHPLQGKLQPPWTHTHPAAPAQTHSSPPHAAALPSRSPDASAALPPPRALDELMHPLATDLYSQFVATMNQLGGPQEIAIIKLIGGQIPMPKLFPTVNDVNVIGSTCPMPTITLDLKKSLKILQVSYVIDPKDTSSGQESLRPLLSTSK